MSQVEALGEAKTSGVVVANHAWVQYKVSRKVMKIQRSKDIMRLEYDMRSSRTYQFSLVCTWGTYWAQRLMDVKIFFWCVLHSLAAKSLIYVTIYSSI